MESDYRKICEKLCTPECTRNEFNSIKGKFTQDIRSERLMEKIDNLQFLIKVLERRDVINLDNLKPLESIAESLKRPISFNGRSNSDYQFEHVAVTHFTSEEPDLANGPGKYNS